MEFEEVDIVCALGPEHPDYRKPDIGKQYFTTYKQLLAWQTVCPSCMPDPTNPEQWTIINTHLGKSTIAMPYKTVCRKIKEAYFFHKEETVKEAKENLAAILDGIEKIVKAYN